MRQTENSIVHPQAYEIDEVFAFLVQCDLAEYGEPDASREDLENEWQEMDLTQDAWIGRDQAGKICGYGVVTRNEDRLVQDVYIDPGQTPAGVEDELISLCVRRVEEWLTAAPTAEPPQLIGYVTSVSQRLQAAYERADFARHTYHYRMQIDLPAPLTLPDWPATYQVSAYKPEDEDELYHFIQTSFDWPGHTDQPFDSWRSLIFRGGRFDPQLFFLVRQNAKLVGAALTYDEEQGGWIRQLAVSKEQRGSGLGSLLLKHVFAVYSQRGRSNVALGVASVNATAYQFYERNGMNRKREFIEYRKAMLKSSQSKD